ncbi:MAG: hypothetical protein CMO01_07980 [Thalassobius sp.]|nr:hypothetical protein [Thalassovita sp.]
MEVKIFNKYKLNPSNYLIGIFPSSSKQDTVEESYYYDSKEKLPTIREKWKFHKGNEIGGCGSEYEISIMNSNQLVDNVFVCFSCNTLLRGEEVYKINKDRFFSLIREDFIPLIPKFFQFSSIESGRKFLLGESENKNLILFENKLPNWLRFEGEFEVHIYLNKLKKLKNASIENQLQNEFKAQFPSETFELSFFLTMGMGDKVLYGFKIFSSKSVYDNLKGFEKGNWKNYNDFSLNLYYKK